MNLNSKEHLANEAERLFVYNLISVTDISERLNLSLRTVSRWRDKFDWERKRKEFLKSKESFHHELYDFARKLMRDITADMDSGDKIDPSRMYAFCKIIPMFAKVKDYEDNISKKEEKQGPKGITPELIAQIEEEVLGITHNGSEEK